MHALHLPHGYQHYRSPCAREPQGLRTGSQKQHSGSTGCLVSNSWLHCDLTWSCSNPLPANSKKHLWLSILQGRRPHQENAGTGEF